VTPSQRDQFTKRTLRWLQTALEKQADLSEQIHGLVAALVDAPDVPADDLKNFMAWADSLRVARRRGYEGI